MKFIDIKNCYKVYKNGVTAIADLTLQIDKGEFVFITGLSGCGKSTLVKMLYREEKPTKGQVMVGGINVAKLYNSKVYKLRRKLGIVFQDFKLLPKLTVYENVAFGLENLGMKKSVINLIKYFAICRFSAQTGTKNRHFMPARRLARHCKRVRRRALTITAGAARIR